MKEEKKNEKVELTPEQKEQKQEKKVGLAAGGFATSMMAFAMSILGGLVWAPFIVSIVSIVLTSLGLNSKKQPYTALGIVALPTSIITLIISVWRIIKPLLVLAIVIVFVILYVAIVFVVTIIGVLGSSALMSGANSYLPLLF